MSAWDSIDLGERKREEISAKAGAVEAATDGDGWSPLEDGTDDGLARRLVRLSGSDILFTPARGWLVWDGTRFCEDTRNKHAIGRRALDSANAIYADAARAAKSGDDDLAEVLVKIARAARRWPAIRNVVEVAERDPRVWVDADALDADGCTLNTPTGTLDIRTRTLRTHDRRDRLTRCTPIGYDEDAEAPDWLAWMERFQPDADVRWYLQKLAGSCLLGIPNKTALAIHYGAGANGKSTYINAVRYILGRDYCGEMPASLLTYGGDRPGEIERLVVKLPGKRLATTAEPVEGQRLNETAAKRLVSDEPLPARFLYCESFEFVPVCTVQLSTNHRPTISGDDDGLWRRVALVPWAVQVPEAERDPLYVRKLVDREGAGILRWAVDGAQAFLAEGLALPEAVRAATAEYRAESDAVGGFIAEWCVEGTALIGPGGELHKAFVAFCRETGAEPIAANTFAERMRRRGFTRGEGRARRSWRGIDLDAAVRERLAAAGKL